LQSCFGPFVFRTAAEKRSRDTQFQGLATPLRKEHPMKTRHLWSVIVPAAILVGLGLLVPARGFGQAGPASKPAASAPAGAPASASAPAGRAVHAFVSGKVQGVGFRAWTVTEAKALKLTGWVKNLTDGRVEAVIEGPADAVATLLEKLKKGPDAASVTDVKSTDQAPTGEFKDFQQR
jgi:acylphosphatase